MVNAFELGADAFALGASLSSNPFAKGSDDYINWESGYFFQKTRDAEENDE